MSPAAVLRIRHGDSHAGCHSSCSDVWINKRQHMYVARRDICFGPGVQHWNLIIDPATHSKKEAMAGVAWFWEMQAGCFPDFQWIPAAKVITGREQEMPDCIAEVASIGRLERVASFRQLQGVSHMLSQLTARHIDGVKDLTLPENVLVRPVNAGECRIVEQDGPTSRAKIVDVASGTCRDVLPDAFTTAPMVTLGLDQGSVGTALVAFSNFMGGMIHCRWDKYHRIVRDVKLAFAHAAGGVFLKAQLYTSYLWSVNRKPFSSGAFGTQKKWMLEIFLETHDRGSSPLWQKYGWRIAEDLGMPFHTDEEQEAVWREVALTPSFNQACEDTKLGRWFSWNASARKYMREYNATKMLLESHVHDISDPDSDAVAFDNLESAERAKTPREQLAQLRSTTGGLRLAFKLMTTQLLMTARIMYVATMAGWSWYSREVTDIKTPQQGLRRALASSQGK